MIFLKYCAIGILIGCGAILPGISSGVFCVIFGIYEKLIDSILNFFKTPIKNIKFLFPIILGVFIGVFIFSKIINYFLIAFPLHTKSIFIGLILGSIPSLFKELKRANNFELKYIPYTLIAFIIGIFSVILEKNFQNNIGFQNINFLYLALSGFFMSFGVVIPGISSTVILMLFGIYNIYLSSISSLFFPILIPIGIGLFWGCIVLMKLTSFLFKNYYTQTFFTILGFSLGSIFILMPNLQLDLNLLISFLYILLGCFLVNFFNIISKN